MKKIISFLLSVMMLVSLCTVVLAEEEPFTVVFSESSGVSITANSGQNFDLEDIDVITFENSTESLTRGDFTISADRIEISKTIIRKMILHGAKETSVGSFSYNLFLLKKAEGNSYDLLQSVTISTNSNFLFSQIDSQKATFQETTRNNYKYYEIVVTDMELVDLNPYYLNVYFGEQYVSFDYDRENSTGTQAIYFVDDYYLNSHIIYGTYNPKLSAIGYNDYTFTQSITVGSKPNNLSVTYNETDGELEIDFSACSVEDRTLMMDIMLTNYDEYYTKYPNLGFYAFGINGVDAENNKKYGDNQPIYKKSDTKLAVRGWMIDLAKNPEETKDNNTGFIQLPGYKTYQIPMFTVDSASLPKEFDAKVTYEKDGVYLDVECVTKDVLSKVDSLSYFAFPYVKMSGGVGVWMESLVEMEARGVLTKINDHSFRVRLNSNTDQRFNGYQGFSIRITGMYGKDVGDAVKTVVAPKVGNVDSNASTLSDITLADGWPNVTVSNFAYNTDQWHWIDSSESVTSGGTSKHWAEIEVWDYKGSTHLSNSNEYVDYEAICSKLDNVKYVVEGDRHYLRAEVIVSVPQSVGAGIKTSVASLDPTDKTLSTSTRTDVDKIQNTTVANGLTEVKYFDIKLDDGATTEISNEAQLKVVIPEWVQNEPVPSGYQREYSVVTVHNGTVRTIEATDNGDGTATFGSDKFSIFTLTYKDVPLASAGGPGPSSPVSTITRKPVVNTSAK